MKAEELYCGDVARLVPNNREGQLQLRAAQGELTAQALFDACLELSVLPALKALAATCAIVCDAEVFDHLSSANVLDAASMAHVIGEDEISARAEELNRGAYYIVLSITRARVLMARCAAALAQLGARAAQPIVFFEDAIPHLSCKKPLADSLGAPSAEPPQHKYVLVSGGRTGSTVMLDILSRNAVGAAKEHLRPPIYILHALAGSSFSLIKWYEGIVRIDTRNRLFGTKIAPNFLFRLWPYLSQRERVYFRKELESARIVYSFRKDLAAQTVSMFRADRSTVWEVTTAQGLDEYKAMAPPDYDFDGLCHLYGFVEKYDAAIAQFLATIPGDKLGVSYEDLEIDKRGAFDRMADFIGVPGMIQDVGTVFKKTADQHSQEMIERFRHDFTRRTGRAPERRA
jgi:LPS sulfotransferase NodH